MLISFGAFKACQFQGLSVHFGIKDMQAHDDSARTGNGYTIFISLATVGACTCTVLTDNSLLLKPACFRKKSERALSNHLRFFL